MTETEMDEIIQALGLTSETATRLDNAGLNRETNGYVPKDK